MHPRRSFTDVESAPTQPRLPDLDDHASTRLAEARSAVAELDPPQRERAALMLAALDSLMAPRLSIEEALGFVVIAFHHRYGANSSTCDKYLLCVKRMFTFFRYSGLQYVDEIDGDTISDFLEMPAITHGRSHRPKPPTRAFRRSVAKAVVDELIRLGADLDREVIGPPIPRIGGEPTRPLSLEQLDRLHAFCGGLGRLGRTPSIVTLCEAGGSMREIAMVRAKDIDLAQGTVTFRFARDRTTSLTEWGIATLEDALDSLDLDPTQELFAGGTEDPEQVGHVLRVQVQKMLRACGIPGRSGFTARSIGLCIAAQIAETDSLQAAAAHLGCEAKIAGFVDLLGLNWDED